MSGKAFGNMAESAINEAGDDGATNTEAALEHSQPSKEAEHMSRCGYNGDSTPFFNENIGEHHDLSRIYCASENDDAETLYYMMEALAFVRPSIIFSLAKFSASQEHYLAMLKAVSLAAKMPESVEMIAGDAVDTFAPDDAENADHAYNLMMLAASHARDADPEWQSTHSLVTRLHQKVGGQQ